MRFLAKGLLFLILFAAVPALAQVEPPARVGRVSVVSGTLAFYGPGDTDWSAAKINLPVAAGAWLATDPQSRAEMRVGSDSIDLSNDTQLNFAELRGKVMQIALAQGRIDLHVRGLKQDETAEIDVARGGVWLLQPGIYDIDSGGQDQPTRITVFEGGARFAGGGIDTPINAGDVLVLSGNDTLSAAVEQAAQDEFVRWCRSNDYDLKRLAAPHHVSPAMTGYEELDAHGGWAAVPTYGEAWFPTSVPASWAPYREGRWVWIEPWGWNWVDDEPWGFAPFHYGRWARVGDRWGWVPGEYVPEPVYAPALVAFIAPPAIGVSVPVPVDTGPPVGWFPLAPGEVYWPTYTRDPVYIRNVNITNVNITKINTIIASRPANADPPPQAINQQFANRAAATMVPARVLVQSDRVAPAAVAVAPQILQQAAVSVKPPPIVARPAATASTQPNAASPSPPLGRVTPPVPSGAMTATQPAAQAKSTAPAPAHPPTRPNFSQLTPAPRVGHAQEAPQIPSGMQAPPPGTRQPPAPMLSTPQPSANASPSAPTPGHPPGPPNFSHLPPAQQGPQPSHAAQARSAPPRDRPPAVHGPAQAGPAPAPPTAHAPPSTNAGTTPSVTPDRAAQQRGAAEAAARQQAQQRAAAEAAVRQQAQQRAAAEAAARQQAQQRAAVEAAARQQAIAAQQAQQRAAAGAAARQQAAQQAQQRAAAEAAARQQAAQQAQQRAAAAAHQQHAEACGHPGQPPCPK